MKQSCYCRCHQSKVADAHEAAKNSEFGRPLEPDCEPHDVLDPIDAVTACGTTRPTFTGCLRYHIAVLRERNVWEERYVPDPNAWVDSDKRRS